MKPEIKNYLTSKGIEWEEVRGQRDPSTHAVAVHCAPGVAFAHREHAAQQARAAPVLHLIRCVLVWLVTAGCEAHPCPLPDPRPPATAWCRP